MIRSRRIPPVLDRICDKTYIHTSLLVTLDGELLGSSSNSGNGQESFGTLVADASLDYVRLGEELAMLVENARKSQMNYLLMEFEKGIVGVASCGVECFVIAVAHPATPLGLIKSKLQALALHIHESFSTLHNDATS